MPFVMRLVSGSHGWKVTCWEHWRDRSWKSRSTSLSQIPLILQKLSGWRSRPEGRLLEPRAALVAGPQGTELHERLLREADRYLSPTGAVIMEIGAGQAPAMRRIIERMAAYRFHRLIYDEAGLERVVIVERVGA